MTDAAREKSAVHEGTVLPPGDDAERLRAEIEQTRERLGETVEQLAAKLDVKTRARAKTAELTGQLTRLAKSTAARAREQAAAAGKSAPGSAQKAVAAGAGTARKHPVPLAAGAGGVLAVLALIMWMLRGQRGKR
jgi:septal ring factor EnvC (AmiA/AmiB activator)